VAESGEVPAKTVLEVLRSHGVEISEPDQDGMVVLAKGDKLESRRVPPYASKKLLQYFSRQYEIPIHHFYNPDMVPKLNQ